jgi:hypothetical protein
MLVGAWLVAAGWLVALVLGVLYIGAVVLYVGGVVVSLVLVRNLDFDRFFPPIFEGGQIMAVLLFGRAEGLGFPPLY